MEKKNLEYAVHLPEGTPECGGDTPRSEYFRNPDAAISKAFHMAREVGKSIIDILIYSGEAANAYGGPDAKKAFKEDPDASVFERFEITVKSLGKID